MRALTHDNGPRAVPCDHLPALHPAYVRLLLQVLREDGIDVERLLLRIGQPGAPAGHGMVSLQALRWLVLAATTVAGPTLARRAGERLHPGQHGALGLALAASATVGDALAVLARFLPLRMPLWRPAVERLSDGALRLALEPRYPLQEAARFLTELTAAALDAILRSLVGAPLAGLAWAWPWDAPPGRAGRRADDVAVPPGARCLALLVPAAMVVQRCPGASPDELALALQACETALQRQAEAATLTLRVSTLLQQWPDRVPDVEQVLAQLGLPRRQVERQLRMECTSLRVLLEQRRRECARWQLQHTALPVADIAARLGYADPSNFSRVLRRWFGCTPSELRDAPPSAK